MGSSWAPGPGAPVAVPKQPGVLGIVLGILIMILGPLLGAVVLGATAVGSVDEVSKATEYMADGTDNTVYLEADAEMGIWIWPGQTRGRCGVTSPTGDHLTLDTNMTTSTTVQNFK